MAEVTNPVKMTPETVQKIEQALMMDCTINEVCLFANIRKQTYYNWIESFPELKERFDYLKDNLKVKSKYNISEKLNKGDVETSKWYLERRDKQYKAKQDITSDDKPLPLLYGISNNDINSKDTELNQ